MFWIIICSVVGICIGSILGDIFGLRRLIRTKLNLSTKNTSLRNTTMNIPKDYIEFHNKQMNLLEKRLSSQLKLMQHSMVNMEEQQKKLNNSLVAIYNEMNKMVKTTHDISNRKKNSIKKDECVRVGEKIVLSLEPEKTILYTICLGNGLFQEVDSKEDVYYKLTVDKLNKNEAKFSICGNSQYAINNSSAMLDGYCDIINGKMSGSNINMIKEGVVCRKNDKQWQVLSKAEVEII